MASERIFHSSKFSQFSAPFHPIYLKLGTEIGHTQLKVFYIDFEAVSYTHLTLPTILLV